ncbi:dTDP-4-dehydrorhamnose reductase [Paucilactobacillus nenjiangensis]|jgi:dTDP-4-dehydrorhamnose reductase|uniref:dTDP-4-dehydrorhamnose reductase n=1 Tax=Paucilactobacillus nenjiangensis TaxID=1296540 RepID=A0A5P1X5L0_9LACO|nr:dTDP-4-dehydrorhamnose reductase [Paucilactobacillus nenjiangensis]QER68164.1 dTDP-4-dehydrorhamnose reductase [Paucilactobacillus nenjiangensis]
MAKYMITGIKGQLGTELSKLMDEKGLEYVGFDATDLDITDRDLVANKVSELKPEIIFHCAAYTAVDNAEDDGKDANWLVNVNGTKNVADAANEVGATLVYISTDYVFDGTNAGEYNVDDATNPQNEYGLAKLAGELAVKSASDNYYIIRTSWVFGEFGKNFVFTMQNLAETHDELTVVNDQTGRPTWTRTLAEFMLYLVQNDEEHGVYHLSNDNSATWFDFATEILKGTDTKVVPVDSSAYKQKAHRPEHSIMNLDKAKATGFNIPTWQEALASFQASIK